MMWLSIAVVALMNLAIYSHIVEGEDAINLNTAAAPPSGSPLINPTPAPPSAAYSRSQLAEADDSTSLPGRFVPTQGRQHTQAYPLPTRVPFCKPDTVSDTCYASNPPTSGMHLPVQGTVLLASGDRMRIPPDPGVYEIEVPREAIPHIEEHAGVYIGYNCSSAACNTVAERMKDLVTQEISLGARVVVSPDSDLDDNTIGVASWTRVDTFAASDYTDDRVRKFIKAHSCRFDPEEFCVNQPQLN